MSSYALDFASADFGSAPSAPRGRPRRGTAQYRVNAAAWQQVTPAQVSALRSVPKQHASFSLVSLVVAAIALHGVVLWYVQHAKLAVPARVQRHEVAVELVRPPKPVPPKLEQPKPQPQPRKQPARVLPQIQTAQPDPPVAAEAVPTEAPVAVAPITAAAPAEPTELPITAPVGHAGYLNNPPPEYPPAAARQNWQGTVVLRVRVLSNGQVETIEVSESSGRRILDEQAVRTVKTWLFTPSKRGDTPIDGWATVPIEFRLDS